MGLCYSAAGDYLYLRDPTAQQDLLQVSQDGQLRIPVPGSSGGLLLGTDASLYQSAVNTLATSGNLTIAGNATVDHVLTLPCPVNAYIPAYILNMGWLWHYTSGIWDPSGMPIDNTTNSLVLQHPTLLDPNNNNQPYFADWTLAMIDNSPRTDYPYWPIMYTHSGVMIQRDLSVGGFVCSNQGALAAGHGLKYQMDPPKIWLTDSGTSLADNILYAPSDPQNPKDLQLYICNTDQNPSRQLYHIYQYSVTLGSWSDLGPMSQFQSQYFDTLYIQKANCKSAGNLNVANITMDGYSRITWNTPSNTDWYDIGSIRFNNTSNSLGMEFKGTVHDFDLGSPPDQTLYPVLQMNFLDPSLNNGYTTTHEFDMNGNMRIWGNLYYAGSLVPFDSIDDFAALRTIKTKIDGNGKPIHDPATLKFLQDDKGLFSLGACVGWELSIEQKLLSEIDSLKVEVADLQSQLNALKTSNQKGAVN